MVDVPANLFIVAHEERRQVVAQLTGHAKVDTTLNVYTQAVDRALRTAVDKIGS